MAPEQQKKPIDFGGNPDHVTLWVRVGVVLGLRLTFSVSDRTVLHHVTSPVHVTAESYPAILRMFYRVFV